MKNPVPAADRDAVIEYDPIWPRLFDSLRESVDTALQGVPHSIQHVGSTSVPGLAGKPVIDMDIVLHSAADFSRVITALALVGYRHRGDLGIAGREAFEPSPSLSTWVEAPAA